MRWLVIAGSLLVGFAGQATETTELPARYQSLIDRSPFGQVQAGDAALAPNWLATYVLTGIIQSNSGNGVVQAIISTKDNAHWYFRTEGEIIEAGVTVFKIDQSSRQTKVVLKNGLETGTLTFAERANVASAAPPAAAAAQPPGLNIPQIPGSTPAPATSPGLRRIPFRGSK
jgi:hypothetical protein